MSRYEYTEMKDILEKHDKTHEEMDSIWQKMIADNKIVANLAANGQSWYDLPKHLIDDLIARSNKYE